MLQRVTGSARHGTCEATEEGVGQLVVVFQAEHTQLGQLTHKACHRRRRLIGQVVGSEGHNLVAARKTDR